MTASLKKVKASMMNAIHDLPLLVAGDEGFFRDEGLDVEIVRTPGSGQRDSDHQALRANVFDRTMEALYDQGACDQFRMCEWGVMKRAVESTVSSGHRAAKIVALGSAMSTFAIVTDPRSRIYEPDQLKDKPIGVSPFNGSHFTTLKLLEGFLKQLQRGEVRAVERADADRLVLQLLRLVDARPGIRDDRESRHRRAQRHDLGGAVPGAHRGLDRALHDSPLAHPELVARALIVKRLHGAIEHVGAQGLVVRVALTGTRGADDLHVQALVPEEPFVAGHQQGQIVDGVHHRCPYFLKRCGHGAPPILDSHFLPFSPTAHVLQPR